MFKKSINRGSKKSANRGSKKSTNSGFKSKTQTVSRTPSSTHVRMCLAELALHDPLGVLLTRYNAGCVCVNSFVY